MLKILLCFFIAISVIMIVWGLKAPYYHFDKITEKALIDFVRGQNPYMSEEDAKLIVRTTNRLSYKYRISGYYILGIIYAETDFQNIYGDNNRALGYGQIHYQTFEWIKMKFRKRLSNIDYKELINHPDVQIELIYMHLYLLLKSKKASSIEQAISRYNGSESIDSQYTKKVLRDVSVLKRYVKEYKEKIK